MARKPSGLGTGFVLCQYLDEENASRGVKIIHCGSGKQDPNKDYSPIEATYMPRQKKNKNIFQIYTEWTSEKYPDVWGMKINNAEKS